MQKQLAKIVMIGPVYPYKGGIAHYTGLMYRNMKEKYPDVTLLSYSMQYPKILFRKPQKDYENDTFKIDETQFIIHTANPANWKKTAAYINSLAPDLVIFQWWHPYFAPCYKGILKRLKGTKVLFACHNVFPHERFPMDRKLTRSVLKKGDYFTVNSQQDADDLQSILPGAAYEKTVHPTYNAFKFEDMPGEKAREILGIGAQEKVLLFFGFVREYKGLRHLIFALPDIKQRLGDVRLLVVGDFGKNKEEYLSLIENNGIKDSVDIYDGYIPDREVEKFFAVSDLVVLPYESATQSGIVQIAYGFDKPVVATDVGGLPEVVLDNVTGYIVPPRDPQALAGAVVRFFEENKAEPFAANVREEAYRYEWDRLREAVERLWAR